MRSQSLDISSWVVEDLDGDRRTDLLQVWNSLYNDSSYLRGFDLRAAGNPNRGFPFDASGTLAASSPLLVDLAGDCIDDLVMLVADGGNGGWLLAAWDRAPSQGAHHCVTESAGAAAQDGVKPPQQPGPPGRIALPFVAGPGPVDGRPAR